MKKIALVMGNTQQRMWDLPAQNPFALNAAIDGIPSIDGIDDHDMPKGVAELAAMLQRTELMDQPVRKLSLANA